MYFIGRMRHFLPILLLCVSPIYSWFCSATDTECPNVVGIPRDRRESRDSLRIVQYNVEWLFIDYYASFGCPGENCTWKNETEAYTHLQYVADVIKTVNPDILNLCEVEGCDELNMLTDFLDGTYATYLKKGTDTSTGQNVGVLTRIDPYIHLYRTEERVEYPIPESLCGYTGPTGSTGVSKHYITEYKINGMRIAVIGAHLLANPTDPTRCAEREAQAQVLQNVIVEYIKDDYELLLIGDLNDFDAEIPDLNNNMPKSMVLDILKGYRGIHELEYTLYSVSETIPRTERYSDWWDPNGDCISQTEEFSMIDHILVTDTLRKYIVDTFVYHVYDEFCGKYNSDHYPLIIDLKF